MVSLDVAYLLLVVTSMMVGAAVLAENAFLLFFAILAVLLAGQIVGEASRK